MLQSLMIAAALSLGFLDAWSVGEHDYLLAVANRDRPEAARSALADAMQYFDRGELAAGKLRSYGDYGNTLYLTGRRAEAIAVFRRGISHGQEVPLLRKQLAIAESELAGTGNPMPMSFSSPWLWGHLASTLSALLVLATAAVCAIGRRWNRPRLGLVGLLGASAVVFGLLAVGVLRLDSPGDALEAYTVRQEASLHVGNGPIFDPISPAISLRPGQAVHILTTRGGWSRVACPDGKTGWLKSDVLIH
jgi:hypothetical protein